MSPETTNKTLLVIDDEDAICLAFERFFGARGWSVRTAATGADGLAACRNERPAVTFLDIRLPDRSGLDLLDELSEHRRTVIVITAYGGLDTVVRALQGKAYDYLAKPIDLDKAITLAERALAEGRRGGQVDMTPAATQGPLVGRSPAMQEVYKRIARAVATNSAVLITGETGTGKELAAAAIHQFSPRRDQPFVAINCGAIPEHLIESELFGHTRGAFTGAHDNRAGKFAQAQGGCLLLDEIADLSPALQVKLLRVLDSGVVEPVGAATGQRLDVRILAATNKNLPAEVEAGRFRRDLYYRLAVLHINLPPLRQRPDDIPLLARHFIRQLAPEAPDRPHLIEDETIRLLTEYNWPGNVRELRNAIDHALLVAPDRTIKAGDLPETIRLGPHPGGNAAALQAATIDYAAALPGEAPQRHQQTVTEVERSLIRDAMRRFDGNQSEAARYLGLHRNTLRKKLRDLRIDA
ncbi:MAG: sigma-54-dependent Fis family transcriptional regulator [Phycisphaerae bacterium]|nr:sigma-54-dependent Fis family transcriptional regulator [Phycisphaerae bacterium]